MFGGLVEAVGIVKAETHESGCKHFSILPQIPFDDVNLGDSVAVNGVCLTVTKINGNCFDFTAVPETLALSNLGQLSVGSLVNLERSLKVNARIGGHYVQGHTDGTGEITNIQAAGAALLVTIKVMPELAKYIVKKGYVALDGMSITVAQIGLDELTVTFIPHTQQMTIVKNYHVGTQLNIEVDILGKYAEKLLGATYS